MARHRIRLAGGRWRLVWDTAWIAWHWEPTDLCWGVHVSRYETATHDTGVVLDLGLVPTVRVRITVVVYGEEARS